MAYTPLEGLRVIQSGSVTTPDPVLLLRSPNMKAAVHELKKRADLVIFDSPPLLAVADPMVLASMVDGAILVVDSRKAGRSTVKRAVESLNRANVRHVAAVVNRAPKKEYSKYGYYHDSDYTRNAADQRRGFWAILFFPGKILTRLWARSRRT